MTRDPPPKFVPNTPTREVNARPMPKRFYANAGIGRIEIAGSTAYQLLLDNRPARTPRKRALALPDIAFAEAVAAEWQAQQNIIDTRIMPLTTLACTTIDAVTDTMAAVAAEIVQYAGSDLLCYRATSPAGLVRQQTQHWNPPLAWARATLKAPFVQTEGMMPIAQPPEARAAIARAIAGLDPFRLAATHVLTTILGSAVLAVAVLQGQLSIDAAWTAAHVDEDWQITQWGADHDAAVRRQNRHRDATAAARVFGFAT